MSGLYRRRKLVTWCHVTRHVSFVEPIIVVKDREGGGGVWKEATDGTET